MKKHSGIPKYEYVKQISILFWMTFPAIAFAQEDNRPLTIEIIQRSVRRAISKTEKAVVAIGRGQFQKNGQFVAKELGIGISISSDGFILTNYHLLGDPKNQSYAVWIVGQKQPTPAKLIAADPWTDLAILKIRVKDISFLSLNPAVSISKGDFIIAFGNPYTMSQGASPDATWGIVSNIHFKPKAGSHSAQTIYRHGQLFQTDAKLKVGQSGGPVVNLQGELVGIQTALSSVAGATSDGSFAVKIDKQIIRVIGELKSGKTPQFGFLGVNPLNLNAQQTKTGIHGVVIGPSEAFVATPASRFGLELDDIISHVNETEIHDSNDLHRAISLLVPGTVAKLQIQRTDPFVGRTRRLQRNVRLARRPNISFRASISSVKPVQWKGIEVDYVSTASDLTEIAKRLGKREGVLIREMDPQSPLKTQLSVGFLITQANGRIIDSPNRFHEIVSRQSKPFEMQVIANTGENRTIKIQP